MEREDKIKALEAALTQIEKQYGKGAVMKLGDPASRMNVETIPTGSISLDIALGLGGIPKGRVIEIYGPESSGKTTVTLHMIAEVQKRGGICGFIDAEHALDPAYAKNIGVDVDNLYISQPDNGEQALFETVTEFRNKYDLVVYIGNVENASNKTTNRLNWHAPYGAGNNIPWFVEVVPTVFISLQNPYHLLDVPMVKTYINAYSNHDLMIDTVVEKLVGKSEFTGKNPVDPFCGKDYLAW